MTGNRVTWGNTSYRFFQSYHCCLVFSKRLAILSEAGAKMCDALNNGSLLLLICCLLFTSNRERYQNKPLS